MARFIPRPNQPSPRLRVHIPPPAHDLWHNSPCLLLMFPRSLAPPFCSPLEYLSVQLPARNVVARAPPEIPGRPNGPQPMRHTTTVPLTSAAPMSDRPNLVLPPSAQNCPSSILLPQPLPPPPCPTTHVLQLQQRSEYPCPCTANLCSQIY